MRLDVVQGCFSYTIDKPILKDLSLSLEEGKFLCVLGQNGIGKTTFLRCLTGVLKWESGFVNLNGEKIDGIANIKDIAYVPQAHQVTFPYTALDMVCMGRTKHMKFFSMPSKLDRSIAMESLEQVGIEHLAERKCSQMSGGQLQMVYIARALASNPKLLILDEPEAHLDFKNQELVLNKLSQLVKKRNLSCIMNTHNPEHALRVSDYTLLLGSGGIYEFGDTSEVLTEKNISRFFGVTTRILDLKALGIDAKAFVLVP